MNEQAKYFKPYLKKAIVLLMAVIMVFTYMPSTAWAGEYDTEENGATKAIAYTGSVVTAPLHDNSSESPIADSELFTYYNLSYADGTAKLAAIDIKEHKNGDGDGNDGKWIGIGIEIPSGTNYSDIKVAVNDVSALTDANMTKADFTANEKDYLALYWEVDREVPIDKIFISFNAEATYVINVKVLTNCNIYVGNESYSGTEKFVLGKESQMTAYIRDSSWGTYANCQWDIENAPEELGIDKSAEDATDGYGASVTFTPQKAGKYQLNLKNGEGVLIKTVDINVVANDLRGLASGTLDFYAPPEWGESSMLGNSWYAGNELKANLNDTPENLKTQYKYLSAYTTAPEGKKYQDMTVNWYYSDTYSETGEGYRKVPTGGKASGTIGNLTYYNGNGYFENTFFFNIYPDVTTSGTYYYYVEISDGENTITSKSNQAVVQIGIPAGELSESGDSVLYYFNSGGYEYSMLGNNWTSLKPLKADRNAGAMSMAGEYKYLSVCTGIPQGSELKDMSIKWYYGNRYSETGAGYKEVSIPVAASGKTQENGTVGSVFYQNTKIEENYGNYYNFQLTPDTTKTGTYYYYAVVTYGEHILSSVGCQAVVEISSPQPSTTPSGNIDVNFTLQGYGKLPGMTSSDLTVANGTTAADLCKAQLTANGYTYEWTTVLGGYLASITKNGVTLGEFTEGANSGWMYKVNGTAPQVGLASYTLSEGDVVTLYYVVDYTKDPSSSAWNTTTPTVTTDTTSGSTATTAPTETKVTEKTNADGTKEKTATVTVSTDNQTEIIKQATDKKSTEIVLEVASTATGGAQNVQLQLNVSFVKNISEKTDAALTVNTENGTVSLDQDTIKTVLSEAKGATITLDVNKVEKPTEIQKKAAGTNGQILSLTVKSGDKIISDFKTGKVTVTVAILTALQNKRVAAIHIAEDGKIEQMPGKTREVNGKKCYAFTTSHFSDFALVDADELGLETEDEIDASALVAKLTPVARSAKTAKGSIKVTTSLDKSDKAIISDLKDAGYTVKYRFYRSTKKSAGYKSAATKEATTYINTTGKKGTKYFYKVQVRVYDENGKLVAKTALKQCKYASRTK